MQLLRRHIVFRLFWGLLAMHILNLSIDAPDIRPDYIPEDLSYNDIESMTEFVLEDVFDIANAMSEQDEHDDQDGNSMETKKLLYHHTYVTLIGLLQSDHITHKAHFVPGPQAQYQET